MNKRDWNEFVELTQRTGVRISDAQRNLIADADQHIDWLESRKRFSEDQVKALKEEVERLTGMIEAINQALSNLQVLSNLTDDPHVAEIIYTTADLLFAVMKADVQ